MNLLSKEYQDSRFLTITEQFKSLQANICQKMVDQTAETFVKHSWDYAQGVGGGLSCLCSGQQLEKAGVNFSGIEGYLNQDLAQSLGLEKAQKFSATGVSLVFHPMNPFVPAVHCNVRYFDCEHQSWFGGGADLTPCYAFLEDAVLFHQTLKKACEAFESGCYLPYKQRCDEYFYLAHRQETRGVGGVFFDRLVVDKQDSKNSKPLDFVVNLAESCIKTYLQIFQKRHLQAFDSDHKAFQAYRRGRYTEFNLLHDLGTKFGLKSGGRIDSIFMSLPPTVQWPANTQQFSQEDAQLKPFLQARDWLNA